MAKTRARRLPPLEVWKFGGASLADAAAVAPCRRAHRARTAARSWWSSPRSPASPTCCSTARAARWPGGPRPRRRRARRSCAATRELARALVPRGGAAQALLASADAQAREYREIAHAMAALGDLSARASDTLVARGERAASAVVAAALQAAGRRAAARGRRELRRDRRPPRRGRARPRRRRGG